MFTFGSKEVKIVANSNKSKTAFEKMKYEIASQLGVKLGAISLKKYLNLIKVTNNFILESPCL